MEASTSLSKTGLSGLLLPHVCTSPSLYPYLKPESVRKAYRQADTLQEELWSQLHSIDYLLSCLPILFPVDAPLFPSPLPPTPVSLWTISLLLLVCGVLEIPQITPAIRVALDCLQALESRTLLLKTPYTWTAGGIESKLGQSGSFLHGTPRRYAGCLGVRSNQ